MGGKESKEKAQEPREYDPNFGGPMKNRGCTDIACCALFLFAIAVYVCMSILAFWYGDPLVLIYPKDSLGNTCGRDNTGTSGGVDLSSKPYLFYFDIVQCSKVQEVIQNFECPTYHICVKSCPTSYFVGYLDVVKYTLLGNSSELDLTKYICKYDYSINAASFNPNTAFNSEECASYYLDETPMLRRCIPTIIETIAESGASIVSGAIQIVDQYGNSSSKLSFLNGTAIPFSLMQQVGEGLSIVFGAYVFATEMLDDIIDSYRQILGFFLVSMFVCFFLIFLMRWIAGLIVWSMIFVVHLLLGAGVYYSYNKWVELKSSSTVNSDPENFQLSTNLDYYKNLEKTWLYAGIAMSVLLGILLLITCFLCNRIRMAIAVIKEASKAVRAMMAVLFFPVIPWALQMAASLYALVLFTYVASYECASGKSCTGNLNITSNLTKYLGTEYFKYYNYYNIFMMLWIQNFIIAVGQCTLAGAFASYYWGRGGAGWFPIISSFYRCFRYHPGSLAFGALIIAIIQFTRMIVEYIEKKLKLSVNPMAQFIMCACKIYFWCFEKFMKFINKNAYIQIAVYGKNFCFSAFNAFFLILRNAARVATITAITAFLFVLCKIAVIAIVGAMAFLYFTGDIKIDYLSDDLPNLNYYWSPMIVILIFTFFIATIFFDVYDFAIDTIFICVLEDLERHDGSKEKPYHMSSTLMSALSVKNKFKE